MTNSKLSALNADNQLTLWGSQGFLYDLNGNMTADGQNAYTWNARNQLVALTPDGGTASTFTYDAFGRRQKKVINGTETDFLFDQNGNLAAELTDGGEYFTATDLEGFSPDELVCRYTAGADGGLNEPLMAMTDINGSVVGLVGDGGVIQATYAYEPYGATQASGTDKGNSQQYAGRENDGTGVYYYRARYYLPEVGRFLGEDPIGFAGGINIMAYARMSPALFNDPSGLASYPFCGGTYDWSPQTPCEDWYAGIQDWADQMCGTLAARRYPCVCHDAQAAAAAALASCPVSCHPPPSSGSSNG